jgi:hypothetical protein
LDYFEKEYGTEDFCPKSKNHKHEPDVKTLHIDHDGEAAYVDVNCKACGRSGCVCKLETDAIDW